MSAVIAAEAMRRLPRMRRTGDIPQNTRFGDFRVSAEENLAELVARDAFLYAGTTRSTPPDPAALSPDRRLRLVAGRELRGEGVYFLDRVATGVWRLEVYPDAVPVHDPFEPPSADKIVTRAIGRSWPMTVSTCPTWATRSPFSRSPTGNPQAIAGRRWAFAVTPGVYVLSAAGRWTVALPERIGHIGFAEFHAPPAGQVAARVTPLAAPARTSRADAECARGSPIAPPDSVLLFVRPAAGRVYRGFPMRPPAATLRRDIPAARCPRGRTSSPSPPSAGARRRPFPAGAAAGPPTGTTTSRRRGHSMSWVRATPARGCSIPAPTRRGSPSPASAMPGGAGSSALASPSDRGARSSTWRCRWTRAAGARPTTPPRCVVDRVRAREETIAGATAVRLRVRGLGRARCCTSR